MALGAMLGTCMAWAGVAQAGAFLPGEWRITAVTQGSLVGTSTTTQERCLNAPGSMQEWAHLTLPPGQGGDVGNTITEQPGRTIWQSQFSMQGMPAGTVESYHGREIYTRGVRHRGIMTGKGALTYTRQGHVVEQETIQEHGQWLSATCLAHPPKPVTQDVAPSANMQALLGKMAALNQQSTQPSPTLQAAEAAARRESAQQKRLEPLEHAQMQALRSHDMAKYQALQKQIQAIERAPIAAAPATKSSELAHP